ncbi:hypothetical protein [Actinomadura rugatobispora]|uniref:DUF2071 domain-containing protein n=1 Tax=Actinomadura rugatobispora TaxID=1994 RepID=A0ABW1AE24_9ACTN|nr:hypothetical protein GCM10010200_068730 [Actinomadura rugatobispora]
MHVLDDMSGLSERARRFLSLNAWRVEEKPRPFTEMMRVRDGRGRLVPVPFEVVVRREGFAERFGGLRFRTRRSFLYGDEAAVRTTEWSFELGSSVWRDRSGWFFDWYGERMAIPFWFVQHVDGRSGVSDGSFIPVHEAALGVIEECAMVDLVGGWRPLPDAMKVAWRLPELPVVPEASGRWVRWRMDGQVAVREALEWTSERPRAWGAWAWMSDAGVAASDQAAGAALGR